MPEQEFPVGRFTPTVGLRSDAGRVAALVGLLFGLAGTGVALGEVLASDRSLLLPAALPLAGCLALVRPTRAERVPS